MFGNNPIDRLNSLHNLAYAIEGTGGTMDEDFTVRRDRWEDFADLGVDPTADLAHAVESGADPAVIAGLLTGAMARRAIDAAGLAGIRQDVAARLYPLQRAAFDKTARTNYDKARADFNAKAKALVKTMNTVDPDADPADLLDASDATRKAWQSIEQQAGDLNDAHRALEVTADAAGLLGGHEGDKLALVCVPGSADRRAVWQAWDQPNSRARQWGALHKLGAKLEAPPAGELKPYRRPKPIEVRYVKVDHGIQQVDYDPETDTPAGAMPAGVGMGSL